MNNINRKFIELYDVSDYEIMTPSGWKDINSIGKTEEYEVFEIVTESGKKLKCADDHIIFNEKNEEIFVKDCISNKTNIITKTGIENVIKVENLNYSENMYDMSVDGEIYYSNDILSHNTSIVAAYMLHYVCFHDDKTSGIVSNKESSAKEVLLRIKNMYERLPSWIKPGVKNYEQTFVIFENGSRIISAATSKNSFRSWTINGILLADEFAHVFKNLQQEFWSSNYPTISASKEARIIIISTPNGMYDLFHEIYSKAEKGLNGFSCLNVHWSEHPERDEKWLEEQRKVLGEKLFRQEILTDFIGSNDTVIEALTLERLMLINNKPIHLDLNENFRIYEKPVPKAQYVLGVDTSKGVQKDFSVIQVIRIDGVNPIKLEQVAVYENNAIDVYAFAEVVNRIAVYYNQGYIMVENNAEGNTVVSELHWNYENSGLINEGTKTSTLGIRATKKTKPKAVLLMKRLIENDFIKINDRETIRQLTDFIETGNYVYRCDNLHDDLVSGLYWGLWFLQMNILNDSVSYLEKKEDDDDAWGILAGTPSYTEDWSWL